MIYASFMAFFVRSFDKNTHALTDGLGRILTEPPFWAKAIITDQPVWAGTGWHILDAIWFFGGLYLAYLLYDASLSTRTNAETLEKFAADWKSRTNQEVTIQIVNPLEDFVKNTTQPTLLENTNEVNQYINALYSANNQTNITNVVQTIIESGYDLESFVQLIYERTDIDTAKDLESKLLSVKLPTS